MMISEAPQPTDPLVMNLRALVERLADPAGNAERAQRLDATIAQGLDLIERLTGILNSIDLDGLTKAVGLGRELTAVQGNLEMLRTETKTRAEAAAKLKIEVTKRLESLKDLGA
jgi:hypothetical protein